MTCSLLIRVTFCSSVKSSLIKHRESCRSRETFFHEILTSQSWRFQQILLDKDGVKFAAKPDCVQCRKDDWLGLLGSVFKRTQASRLLVAILCFYRFPNLESQRHCILFRGVENSLVISGVQWSVAPLTHARWWYCFFFSGLACPWHALLMTTCTPRPSASPQGTSKQPLHRKWLPSFR